MLRFLFCKCSNPPFSNIWVCRRRQQCPSASSDEKVGVGIHGITLSWISFVLLAILSACTLSTDQIPTLSSTDSPSGTTHTATATYTFTKKPSKTVGIPTKTPTNLSTIIPIQSSTSTKIPTQSNTPIPIEYFSSPLLRNGVSPQTYFVDTCIFLENRWAKENSTPGTVIVPIMFHSIYKEGRIVDDPKEISETEFEEFVGAARTMGFETITTEQLYAFLDHNARIPMRSMIMIVDDRRPGLILERFIPVLSAYDWSVTSAYIADPDSLPWAWDLMDQLFATGRVDIQSHGYSGQLYIVESTREEEIRKEIERSTIVLEERYGKRPIAFIWPGGNFTPLAVEIARQDGYQLGFTAYSRGPLMFNWIPQGEEERLSGDPLMLLPRAWSNSAILNLEQAIEISEMAREFAMTNFEIEAHWYEATCGGKLAPAVEGSIR